MRKIFTLLIWVAGAAYGALRSRHNPSPAAASGGIVRDARAAACLSVPENGIKLDQKKCGVLYVDPAKIIFQESSRILENNFGGINIRKLERSGTMRGFLALMAVVSFFGWLLLGSILTFLFVGKDLVVEGDVDRWFTRAQVAADVEDMLLYLGKTEEGLDKYDIREGHAGLIVRNPANDMGLIRQNLDRLQHRAEQLGKTPVEERGYSAAYQTGLDDLRGTIRELSIPARGYYWRHDGYPLALVMIIVWSAGWLVAVIFGVGAAAWPEY